MVGILWFLIFQAFGICCAWFLLRERVPELRIWLGSVLGSACAIWFPVPFAFLLGFTRKAQFLALGFAAILFLLSVFLILRKIGKTVSETKNRRHSPWPLTVGLPLFIILCGCILIPHTLASGENGLYTGQCTYGDMPMHLGFITSLAEQGTFPPYYSIFPSAKVCYPFLCDSISASLYVLGTSLRWAYIFPMFFALAQVFCGVWFLACEICEKKHAPLLALMLFFLNGGFGIIYFLSGKYSFHELFTGFYVTPTNLTDEGIRWVNVIVDMLIPQRATLFGWSLLFACLWMLFRAVYRNDSVLWLPAGILGGLLPMVHTHSYFALGLVAFCWLVASLMRDGFHWKWFRGWFLFGIPAVILAVPQLLEWTFQSVSGNSHFLRIGLDWVNGFEENWFVFWFKNIGPMFILGPLSFCLAGKEKKAIASGAILIFVLGEIVLFQPNPYDNNKLFYVGYLLLCFPAADFLADLLGKIHSVPLRALATAVLVLLCTNAAVMTIAREVYSGAESQHYMLFSNSDIAAAEYIKNNTAGDSLFLTSDNHNNAVAVLTGRNILCGSPSYLYYHGLDYQDTQKLQTQMLTDAEIFEQNVHELGIDYVYFGPNEAAYYGTTEDWLEENYPLVFSEGNVKIFDVRQN